MPAVYELFGDKSGLVREIFFEGFRRLGSRLLEIPVTPDPRGDLMAAVGVLRDFVQTHPGMAEVMFARPFSDFDPGPAELTAGATVREDLTERLRRCIAAGKLAGDPTDLGHVLIALVQGLARQEIAGWLGSTPESVERRWSTAFERLLRQP